MGKGIDKLHTFNIAVAVLKADVVTKQQPTCPVSEERGTETSDRRSGPQDKKKKGKRLLNEINTE